MLWISGLICSGVNTFVDLGMELIELGLHLVAMAVVQPVELLSLVDGFVEAQMDSGESIIDPGEEQMGFRRS